MVFTDKTLTCRDCGQPFTFTRGEQEFYASKGLTNEPRRCPACRQAYKQQSSGRGERQMYQVVCDACGKETLVPFQPRGDRPVYCSDCFQQRRASRTSSYGY